MPKPLPWYKGMGNCVHGQAQRGMVVDPYMIQLNDFKRLWDDRGFIVQEAIEKVGRSGWYVLGREVELFESDFAKFCGVDHAIGVANGLDAIEIGLRALGIKPGQRILTTPVSAFATTLAIIRAGGRPVFVDTDENGLIDLEKVRICIQRNPDIRFFVPVHLYGHCLDLNELEKLKTEFKLKIVEDCAQAVGSSFGTRKVGSVGQVSAISFYPTKNLGAIGDGGALFTDDVTIAETCKSLRNYGQSGRYRHDVLGLNSRLDELQAALLRLAFLPELNKWNERRRQIANTYLQELSSHGPVRCLKPAREQLPVWHLFPVFVHFERRDLFRKYMEKNGVATGVHYPILITDQRALAPSTFDIIGDLKCASRIVAEEVSLPIHPYMTAQEVEHVISVCTRFDQVQSFP